MRPMLLKPFVQANRPTAKKGAKESMVGAFSYSTCVTNPFCSSSGRMEESAKNSANSP